MTEFRSSKPERELAQFLESNGVQFLWRTKEMPHMNHPITMRPHRPDFYIPQARLFVEVKGQMTLPEVSKMDGLTHSWGNYYVYQVTEPGWEARLDDWPSRHARSESIEAIAAEASAKRDAYLALHPARTTSSWSPRKENELVHQREVQRGELLAICRGSIAVYSINSVTRKRLRRYLLAHLALQGWLTSSALDELRVLAAGP